MSINEKIPESEMDQYRDFLKIFSQGEVILLEGNIDDGSLFLLREGAVSIYKKSGDENKLLDTIEAVNFFGEMALIIGGARSATVVARSDEVVVYKLQSKDLKTIFTNPAWSELLVSRLVNDLKNADNQLIRSGIENQHLKTDENDLQQNISLLFQAFHELIQKTSPSQCSPTNVWDYFSSLDQINLAILKNNFPDVINIMDTLNESALEILSRKHNFQKIIGSLPIKK